MSVHHWVNICIKAISRELLGYGRIAFGETIGNEFREWPTSHPMAQLLSNTDRSKIEECVAFNKFTGEAHWWVIRNDHQTPVEILTIPTHWKRLVTQKDGEPYYAVTTPSGTVTNIPSESVVSFYEHSPLSRCEGFKYSERTGVKALDTICEEWEIRCEVASREELVRDQVLAAFGVPKVVVGICAGKTYREIEESIGAFREYTIRPITQHISQKVTEDIVRKTPGWERGEMRWLAV